MEKNTSHDFDRDATRTSAPQSGSRRRWIQLAVIWGIWTFVGLVFTLQSYFTSYRSEQPISLYDSAYLQFTWSYLWALATPLALWAASKIPIEKNNWVRSLLLHVPISLGLSIVVTAIG